MGVYIKGMEMPTSCVNCRFSGFGGLRNERVVCMHTGSNAYVNAVQYLDDCPLIPVPPHGRLIDADAVMNSVTDEKGVYVSQFAAVIGEAVDAAPTIIPAEEGK